MQMSSHLFFSGVGEELLEKKPRKKSQTAEHYCQVKRQVKDA